MTAVAMPATAWPDMMAWLYTGGKTDARAKLPACTSAVSTPSVMSVTRVIAIVASPLMRLAYVMQPVSASRTAMAKSGAVSIAPGESLFATPVTTIAYCAHALVSRYATPNTLSKLSASAGVNGGAKRRTSKYARSVMNTFQGNMVPAPARRKTM